jgi:hypothetical protein
LKFDARSSTMTASSSDAFRFPTAGRHDAPAARVVQEAPSESALDHGVEESFPASDPVSVSITRVGPRESVHAARPSPATGRSQPLKSALRTGLMAGAAASVLSTVALMVAGRREAGSAVAPTNATSHWLWGSEALAANRVTLRHTALGYLTHHLAAMFWATLYAWLYGNRPSAQSLPAALAGATAASAISCAVDYTVTPQRLRPGFEHRLSRPAMAVMYGAFALGLAAGCLYANRRR